MKQVFIFDSMITPKLVTVLYWLLLISALVSGGRYMFPEHLGFSGQSFLMGLFTMIGGVIGARILCELMIVIFKINSNLQTIKDMQNTKAE